MMEPGNILIVRTDRIGDVILTIPMAGILKKYFPLSKITFLVREYTSPIVKGNKFIDNILLLPEISGKLKFIQTLKLVKKHNFDSTVIVYPTFKIALILFLAGIKIRIGTGFRWYSFLFNKKVFEHRKTAVRHELEYNINLLKYFNINENVSKSNVCYNLAVDKNSELKTVQLLLAHIKDIDLPIMIVHPGSGGSAVDLPVAKMKNLIELTAKELNINIILTGSEEEVEICSKLTGSRNVVNFAGLLNLDELKALISKASLVVANSTGPLHIASALGINVIGFYPKVKACSPERWGPYTEKAVVFQPKIKCNDCTIEQCRQLDCMNTIDMTEVFEQIKIVFKGN